MNLLSKSVPAKRLERTLIDLSLRAGSAIEIIRAKGVEVENKSDLSPVTEADRSAETIVLEGLRETFPDIPIIAEEEASSGETVQHDGTFFLVDPLDGTKEFIYGRREYTVNIALIVGGEPIAGCIYAPAMKLLYYAAESVAYKFNVQDHRTVDGKTKLRAQNHSPRKILASSLHMTKETSAFIEEHDKAEVVQIGSSLKFCLMAEGEADLYPRFSPTMEWDTAAGDAILRCAGGMTRDLDGNPLIYGDRNPHTPRAYENGSFIASVS